MRGARWVAENIVEQHPGGKLKIYTVWVNTRVTDKRDTIDTASVPGSRHYWDDDWSTGRWAAEKDLGGLGYAGAVYDAYFLFDGNATWEDAPAPLALSGEPVVGSGELADAVAKLL